MLGFKPWIPNIASNRSANFATTIWVQRSPPPPPAGQSFENNSGETFAPRLCLLDQRVITGITMITIFLSFLF